MKYTGLILLLFVSLLIAADKKAPQGQAENDGVVVTATVMTEEQIRQIFSTDFGGHFTVMEVRVAPKAGKQVEVRLDDFLLRSNSDLSHSGPLAAAQIVDSGALVVKQTFAPRVNESSAPLLASSKAEMKAGAGETERLALLKQKMLAEKTIEATEEGLLFFPLEREKPKNLALVYTTPAGKIRLQFK